MAFQTGRMLEGRLIAPTRRASPEAIDVQPSPSEIREKKRDRRAVIRYAERRATGDSSPPPIENASLGRRERRFAAAFNRTATAANCTATFRSGRRVHSMICRIQAIALLFSGLAINGHAVCNETSVPVPQKPMPKSEVISRTDDGPFDFGYREEIFKAADRILAPRGLELEKVTILAWSLSYSILTVPPESLEEILVLAETFDGEQSLLVLYRGHSGPPGWNVNYNSFGNVFSKLTEPPTSSTIRKFAASSGFWPSNNPDFEVVKVLICSKIAHDLEKVAASGSPADEAESAEANAGKPN